MRSFNLHILILHETWDIIACSIISRHWDCAESWNYFLAKTITCSANIANDIAADDLTTEWTRVRLSIKMSSNQYRDPHVKDKTVSRPSYHKHGNPYTQERRSLYQDTVGLKHAGMKWAFIIIQPSLLDNLNGSGMELHIAINSYFQCRKTS